MKKETQVVHGCTGFEEKTGAISYPVYMSATFRHPALGESTGYDYSRVLNPTREELEKSMCRLEKGMRCFAYASGMAAITAVFSMLAPNSHILLSEDLYGGTHRLGNEFFARYGIEFEYIDTADLQLVREHIRENTKMAFIETPSNPMMLVSDIQGIGEAIHEAGGLLVVDNTFLTPLLQTPISLGADIVVHSGTKYLCGHNDVIAGFLVAGDQPGLAESLEIHYKSTGAVLSPFDSWLMIRSIKTLSVRMRRQQKNAAYLAEVLQKHKNVDAVYYVGLETHPGYDLNKKQALGAGAMISFRVRTPEIAKKALEKIQLIYFAESLGGVETLLTYPIVQTHADSPEELRKKVGVDEYLLRLSVGIEDAEDLVADLIQALDG